MLLTLEPIPYAFVSCYKITRQFSSLLKKMTSTIGYPTLSCPSLTTYKKHANEDITMLIIPLSRTYYGVPQLTKLVDDDKRDIVNSDFYPLSLSACCEAVKEEHEARVNISPLTHFKKTRCLISCNVICVKNGKNGACFMVFSTKTNFGLVSVFKKLKTLWTACFCEMSLHT